MRSRSLLTLTFIGLMLASPTFNSSAMAASIGAKPAHEGRAGLPTRQRLAHSLCSQPLRFSAEQLIPAVLGMPWLIGPHRTGESVGSMNIDGVQVPIIDCGPAAIDPYTGEVIDNRPTVSGSAWISRIRRNDSGKSSRNHLSP